MRSTTRYPIGQPGHGGARSALDIGQSALRLLVEPHGTRRHVIPVYDAAGLGKPPHPLHARGAAAAAMAPERGVGPAVARPGVASVSVG